MIRVEDLRVEQPPFALGPISLHVDPGEYFVLLGPSGSGKTTLLEWLAGFRSAAAGRLWIQGRDMTRAAPQVRGLGVVYQEAALFPHMSVRENLAFPLRVRGWNAERIEARVAALATLLQVEPRLPARPREISGGEARRVAFGRALAASPSILLLDEPLSALDSNLRTDLQREIRLLHEQLDLTVFHITHDLAEASALASRIAVLLGGRIAQSAPPQELFARPSSVEVARFLMVPNVLEVRADAGAGTVTLAAGARIPARVPRSGSLIAKVSELTVAGNGGGGRLPARALGAASRAEPDGPILVALEEPDGCSTLQLRAAADRPAPGARVWVDFGRAHWELYEPSRSAAAAS